MYEITLVVVSPPHKGFLLLMGAFFLAVSQAGVGDAPDLSRVFADRRDAIGQALKERAPGVLKETRAARVLLLHRGPDLHHVHVNGAHLIVDGALGATRAASEAIREQWRGDQRLPLSHCDGRFAACSVTENAGRVELVRGRFGMRPLVWCAYEGLILVASRIAVLQAAGVPLAIDRDELRTSLRFRWLLGERHLFAPAHQVPVAHSTTLLGDEPPCTRRYWRIPYAPRAAAEQGLEAAVSATHHALRASVEDAMVGARGPVVLLSGGVDSSLIAAAARDVSPNAVALTGRLPDSDNVELERAQAVADHSGRPLHVVDIPRPDANTFAGMVRSLGELPRNPNNVVLQALLQHATEHGDLVLQGDAAEVMFGLSDARSVDRFARKRRRLSPPVWMQRHACRFLRDAQHASVRRFGRVLYLSPLEYGALLEEVRYAAATRARLGQCTYHDESTATLEAHVRAYGHAEDGLQAYQAETFLVSSLVRHDAMAQPFGLASLTPFLLPRILDVACRLPRELRYQRDSKPVLRALCDRLFPPEVSRWPKLGFDVPWQRWFALQVLIDDMHARAESASTSDACMRVRL